jgi:hypothetical protein
MKKPIVVIGIGEMGGVFTRGFLRLGHPVYPVTRRTDINAVNKAAIDPELVLVAVGESDLPDTLKKIPENWRDGLGLLQNELLPQDWKQHGIDNPTLISVWFEKKKGQDYKVIIPSPVFGPHALLLETALESLDIPCWELADEDQLLYELVRKNVYILTSNIAGIITGGTVGELWDQHNDLALSVANEVIDIQETLTGTTLDRKRLIDGMYEAFQGDLAHKCMGRSAPARLKRTLELADGAGLKTSKLREISLQL